MNAKITIDSQDILKYIKLSCQFAEILEGSIGCKIIQKQILARNISVKPEKLQQEADNFRLLRGLSTVKDTYIWLEKHHLSLDEFDSLIYTNTVVQQLIEDMFSEQVDSFFEEHKQDYVRVGIYEVILDDDILARKLFRSLKQGKISFQEVASQYITQLSLRRAGGYRGLMYPHDLQPEIATAVLAATPPQLLQPIITAQGVHLIQVVDIIQPKLDEQLRAQILSELFARWLKQKIDEAEVLIKFELDQEMYNKMYDDLVSQDSH